MAGVPVASTVARELRISARVAGARVLDLFFLFLEVVSSLSLSSDEVGSDSASDSFSTRGGLYGLDSSCAESSPPSVAPLSVMSESALARF